MITSNVLAFMGYSSLRMPTTEFMNSDVESAPIIHSLEKNYHQTANNQMHVVYFFVPFFGVFIMCFYLLLDLNFSAHI